jgi:hypothetical protein
MARNATLELIRSTGRPPLGSQIAPGAMIEAGRRSGATLRTITDRPSTTRVVRPAPAAPRPGQVELPRGFGFAMVDALLTQVPVGRYALPRVAQDGNDVTFFEVVAGRGGAHMITTLSGAPGNFQAWAMKLPLQYFAAKHLLENLVAATALFGHKAKVCGRCNSPLTRQKSREQGMGDHCRNERAAGR